MRGSQLSPPALPPPPHHIVATPTGLIVRFAKRLKASSTTITGAASGWAKVSPSPFWGRAAEEGRRNRGIARVWLWICWAMGLSGVRAILFISHSISYPPPTDPGFVHAIRIRGGGGLTSRLFYSLYSSSGRLRGRHEQTVRTPAFDWV